MRRIRPLFCLLAILGAGVASAQPAATECDLLAGHPSDPDKVGSGVPSGQVRAWNEAAIAACRRDVDSRPEDARLRYNLGRALFYRGRAAEALKELEIAATRRHRQAQFVLGLLYADGVPDVLDADPCRALPLWKDAADRGHYAARISVARDWLRGRYARCAGAPDRSTVGGYLDAVADTAGKDYYQGLLVADLRERWKTTR
jgi:TPR repeat protein